MNTISSENPIIIRQVTSLEELKQAITSLCGFFDPPLDENVREMTAMHACFPEQQKTMIIAEHNGEIAGGVLSYYNTVRIIAVAPHLRGVGLGRRLLETFELGAMRLGLTTIDLGPAETAKGFYDRLGYRGKASKHKELPPPGGVMLKYKLRKLEEKLGDLDAPQLAILGDDGKIPPLF